MDIMKIGKNPNYLGSWDLDDESNRRITVSINKICEEEVVAAGQKEKCAVCYFNEDYKPMILNITNKKRLAKLYKTKQVENLIGKRITIGVEKVKAFGDVYDALRIVPTIPPAPSSQTYKCDECSTNIEPLGKMTAEQVALYTKDKYGKCLCSKCATALANKKDGDNNET